VTSITYPSGHIVTCTRASDGKVTAVSAKPSALGASTNIATSVAYAPFVPLTDLTYGNGLVLERGFDQNYWQNALVVSAPGVDRLDLQFTRNANGDLTGVTDNITSGRAATYGYSDASRLASADGAWGDNGYSWDKAGNRQATSGAGSPDYREAAGYENGSNRLALLSVEGGPLPADPLYTAGDTYAYAYGARQRLLTLKLNGSDIASYQYDHAGQRVSATQLSGTPSTSHFVFAPDGRLLAEHDGATGTMLREYIWLDDMPLALVTGSVATPVYAYVHTGQIGEPLMVTDASKAKVWDAAVDPWGRPTMLATATQDLKLRLPGQWYQAESGLHQNWMRDYDPVLGRYIEADPLGIEAGQNLFGYVDGKPLGYVDPRGEYLAAFRWAVATGEGVADGLAWLCLRNPIRCEETILATVQIGRACVGIASKSAAPDEDNERHCDREYKDDRDTCMRAWKVVSSEAYKFCLTTERKRYLECLHYGYQITKLYLPPWDRKRKKWVY